MVLVALELEHAVDDVLQYLGAGDAALLVDVADEYGGDIALLGELEQRGGTLTYLHDAAGRRLGRVGRDGLYGVDDDEVGLRLLDVCIDLLQRGLA